MIAAAFTASACLTTPVPEPGQQKGFRIGGAAYGLTDRQSFLKITAGKLRQHLQNGQPRIADTTFRGQGAALRVQQFP